MAILTIGCCSVSSQIIKAIKPITVITASRQIKPLLNQSFSCPKSSISCKAPIQTISNASPTASIGKRNLSVSAGFNKRIAATAQIIPTGILIKKIQCQDQLSLIEPPKIGPKMGPTTVVIAHMPMAWDCFSGGKIRISKV